MRPNTPTQAERDACVQRGEADLRAVASEQGANAQIQRDRDMMAADAERILQAEEMCGVLCCFLCVSGYHSHFPIKVYLVIHLYLEK